MNVLIEKLKIHFSELDERYRERPTRERAMIAIMLIGLVFFGIDFELVQPTSAERDRVSLAIGQTRNEIESLTENLRGLSEIAVDPEKLALNEEADRLRIQLAEIDKRIDDEISDLVPPKQIIPVLEELLAHEQGLRLVKLESQPPRRFGEASPATSKSDPKSAQIAPDRSLYHHGLRMELEGNYGATLDYLRRVEAAPWNLLWDRLEYEVGTHPQARVTLELHTISHSEEWIGV